MVEDNFDVESEDDLLIKCGIVSVLPAEYDRVSEVLETEEGCIQDEVANHKLLCYYVMNNGVIEEQQAIFEKPYVWMMYRLKPLFIRAKVDNMVVIKVFVDREAVVNLMSHSLFKKIGNSDTDLQPHNMVLSNYEGKNNHILGVIQVKLSVSTTTRTTFFMVIASNAN